MTVLSMNNVADGKDAVSPFQEKGGLVVILITNDGVVLPIYITGERPRLEEMMWLRMPGS